MSELKRFKRADIAQSNSKASAVFVIDNIVYDVTKFLDDHPGGHEVLVSVAGKDATVDFDDIGHSLDAKEMMKKFQVGELVDEEKVFANKKTINWDDTIGKSNDAGFLSSWKMPVALGLLMTVLYSYLFG